MIRFICKQDDDTRIAACITDKPSKTFKTITADVPELEQWLRESPSYIIRECIGIELIKEAPDA